MQNKAAISPRPQSELLSLIESRTGQKISSCYQCGKCTAGCPTAYAMDLTPRQVMRGVQLGIGDEVLASSAIWVCLGCQTCSVRCPRQIDIARVMEELRLISQEQGIKPAQKDVETFFRVFVGDLKQFGRVNEITLGGKYNLASGHLFANVKYFPGLLSKGKLRLLPSGTKGAGQARKIAARVKKLNSESRRIDDNKS